MVVKMPKTFRGVWIGYSTLSTADWFPSNRRNRQRTPVVTASDTVVAGILFRALKSCAATILQSIVVSVARGEASGEEASPVVRLRPNPRDARCAMTWA
jgi:hypothetical protein